MAIKLKYRTCSECGKELPLTREFFKRGTDGAFHKMCRKCNEIYKHDKEWDGELLKCHKCGKFLPVTEFSASDHYPYRDHHDARCRNCKTKRTNELKKEYSEDVALLKVLQMRFLAARDRSKRKNIPFNITKDYLKELWDKQNGKCAISGIKMTFEQCNGRTPTNVSIDQINHNDGYTINNIQLVCMAVNQMKSDLLIDDLYKFCEAIIENNLKRKAMEPQEMI